MGRVMPAIIALAGGAMLAVLLLVPFVFRSYRRRGELGFWFTVLAFGALVYALALVAYTTLPIPAMDDAWCARYAAHPQWRPFQFVEDIKQYHTSLAHNPAVLQVVFNMALFVPLGAFVARWRGPLVAVLAGFGTSLLIEITQGTGNWFLFPCAYRLFDVDDLMANTVGAAFGVLLAPLVRRLDRTELPADAPRPVTTGRRLVGMLVDLVAVWLLGGVLVVLTEIVTDASTWTHTVMGTWLPAVLLLALPSLRPSHATFGQRAVRLRRDGTTGQVLLALVFGGFGYWMLVGLGQHVPVVGTISFLMLLCSGVMAWRPRSHRGLSGVLSGVTVTDAREDTRTPAAPGFERGGTG